MRDIRNDVGILSETISGIGGAARTMTFAFTAPMVALGTYAVQAASGFDAAMRNINSIMQLSEGDFADLEGQVMSFAKTTRAGVVPATEALYEIFSAGITDQERAMAVWQTSNKVAEAGLSDLTATTNAITATMSAYNLETTEAGRVGNVWTQMVKQGVGSLDAFLSNSQKILPLSSAMNISLEDMGATLAFLSQGGGGAAKAETAYAMMLSNMMKPTEAMTDALGELGVKSGTELIAKFGGVTDAVMALKGAVDETTFNKMFSKTGLEAALRITGNIDQARQAAIDFNKSLDTATMDAWEQQSKSFAFQWDLMRTSLEAVAITIGQAIMPLITPLIGAFSDFLQQVSNTNPELMQLGVIFISVVAAAAPLIWLLTSLLNPIGLIIAGATALSVAIGSNFDGIRDKIVSTVSEAVGGLQPLKDAFDTFMSTLFPAAPTEADLPTPLEVSPSDFIHINPQTQAISLWSFFEGEGFIEKFSWDEFQKMAKDAGWDGGAIKPGQILDLILPSGSGGVSPMTAFEERVFGTGAQTGTPTTTTTIFDRLNAAISTAWPQVQTALDTMWANFSTWVTGTAIPKIDGFGGQILQHIAGWFNTSASNFTGDSKVYDVVTGAMSTNVGQGVTDAAADFQKTFPALTTALNSLFTNMGNWIEAEGLPTLAKSIGFIAGKLASLFSTAIGSIWTSITTGQTGKGAAGAADVVQQSLLIPLNNGIQEGIGNSTDNPFTKFFDNIGAVLLIAAGAWVIAPGVVTAIATPIIGAISGAFTTALAASGTSSAISAFVKNIGVGLSTGFAALSVLGIGAIIIFGLLNDPGIQNGLKAWAGVWDNFKIIVTSAFNSIAVGARQFGRDFAQTITDAQLTVAKARLVLDPNNIELQTSVANLDAKAQGIDVVESFETQLGNYLSGKTANLDVGGLVWGITGQPNLEGAVAPAEFTKAILASITDPVSIQRAVSQAFQTGDQAALNVLIPVSLAMNPLQTDEDMIKTFMATSGLDATTVGTMLMTYYANDPVKVDAIKVAVEKVKVEADDKTTVDASQVTDSWMKNLQPTTTTGTSTTVQVPIDPVADTSKVDTAVQGWATTMAAGLPTAVIAATEANAGNMDTAATSMTQPFVDAFNTTFGAEGTVTATWTTFLTDFGTDIVTLQTNVQTAMPIIQNTILGAMNAIIKSLNDANFIARNLSSTLAALDGSTVTIHTSVTGGVAVDGSHKTGLPSVPYDGYIAELHKGEMVLTAEQAAGYQDTPKMQSRDALPNVTPQTNVDNGTATFNFYEAMDFQKFEREAKKRGYTLDRYKR